MGVFIVFEGGDGGGKTTQIELLEQWLRAEYGIDVVTTRQPGGTELGREIRNLLLHGDQMDARAEALLYAADRAHNAATVIRPAMQDHKVVISDRYLDSSAAYQGAGRGLGLKEVRKISLWATNRLLPNLTVLLDIDPAVGLSRQNRPADRLESESLEFHNRVREGFLELASEDPQRYLVLNADEDPQLLHTRIRERVALMLGHKCTHSLDED